jgi:hypothetical protein
MHRVLWTQPEMPMARLDEPAKAIPCYCSEEVLVAAWINQAKVWPGHYDYDKAHPHWPGLRRISTSDFPASHAKNEEIDNTKAIKQRHSTSCLKYHVQIEDTFFY